MRGAQGRIDALDVIRGIAIIGTLGTNIWIFTHPYGAVGFLTNGAADASWFETAARSLANGKFLALLSLMFGVGLELQYRSARRRGVRWPGWYLWRAGLLFVEGTLHFVLVFEFDVLMGYAVVSVVVAYLIGRSRKVVTGWIAAQAAVHVLVVAGLTWLLVLGGEPGGDSGRTSLYTEASWWEQVVVRLENAGIFRAEAVFITPLSIALFLLGARLARAGLFELTGERAAAGHRLRTRLALFGLGIGVPLNVLTAFAGNDWILVDRYLAPPIVALGLIGLIPALLNRDRPSEQHGRRAARRPGLARRGITAIGRTALTCYVLQNLLASAVCYGWGLGLAGRWADWRPWWVPAAWLVIMVVSAVLASWWLRRFDRGPLELVWQWLYQAPQRMAVRRERAARELSGV